MRVENARMEEFQRRKDALIRSDWENDGSNTIMSGGKHDLFLLRRVCCDHILKCATRVQSHWRGYKHRKLMLRDQVHHMAAVVIQHHFMQWKAGRFSAALRIQGAWRSYAEHKLLLNVVVAKATGVNNLVAEEGRFEVGKNSYILSRDRQQKEDEARGGDEMASMQEHEARLKDATKKEGMSADVMKLTGYSRELVTYIYYIQGKTRLSGGSPMVPP